MENAALGVIAILASAFVVTTAVLGFMFSYETSRSPRMRAEEVERQALTDHFQAEQGTKLKVVK